ncbi:hypothetical protein BU24DRAFT_454711 [Aaosphaeria arxii CBS 175.79]|uniref:Uncharacterized protein n=1 Tax=Aaosphaeria arxii CBS 175.79 TaxID=1450172 RepID=A0A6A5XBU2_9PLEO|nr:uncharacterized protein BU24DRAFT_454711 [Aaosphaeria arxii CBS 175.79]KAF2010316.1 hypothetical protein BU24DRAFT_454711 [Aaosphaeria arxii CBS 175.79]
MRSHPGGYITISEHQLAHELAVQQSHEDERRRSSQSARRDHSDRSTQTQENPESSVSAPRNPSLSASSDVTAEVVGSSTQVANAASGNENATPLIPITQPRDESAQTLLAPPESPHPEQRRGLPTMSQVAEREQLQNLSKRRRSAEAAPQSASGVLRRPTRRLCPHCAQKVPV